LLATPCSGPLLGAVFGYTLKVPPPITYLVFFSIGLGMASPYLLIGAFPRLMRLLPKPGAWMDTFKQMMGFVMLGTIVFFFSFMDRQYLVATFAMMVGLWAGCWWIGRVSLVEPLGKRLLAWGEGGVFALAVGVFAFTFLTPRESIIPWQNFSRQTLAKLTEEGNTVLVDFTAEWCLNCKLNLKHAIETKPVRELIDKNKVVPLLADYTSASPEIKQMLESLNSGSIPVLAVFPAGKPLEQAIVMRDIISQQQVLDALAQAGPSKVAASGESLPAVTAAAAR
jgi:thiol:disulfide interchange protein